MRITLVRLSSVWVQVSTLSLLDVYSHDTGPHEVNTYLSTNAEKITVTGHNGAKVSSFVHVSSSDFLNNEPEKYDEASSG